MMPIRRRRRPEVPLLNTASLPDLIFTVLFFFMMVTHMRTDTVKVKYSVPQGSELTRLARKNIVYHIYIGAPEQLSADDSANKSTLIQLGNKIMEPDDIADYMAYELASMSTDDRKRVIVSVRADRSTHMSVINEVRHALRKAGVGRISLSAMSANDNLIQK